jgi:hypothetical protein
MQYTHVGHLRIIPRMMGPVLIVLAALVAAPQDRAAERPIGMILQTQGETQIRHRTGAPVAARIADSLYPGDRVITAFGRTTVLSCPTAETLTLKEDTEVELNSSDTKTLRGQITSRVKVDICPIMHTALGSESLERVGGLRARGNPPMAIYIGGIVSTGRPTFEWAPVSGAQKFRVTLRDANGSSIWEETAATTSLAYPEAKPLAPGKYQWQVQAEASGKTVAEQSVNFEVKPTTLALSKLPPLMRASALEDAGYFAEAAAEFRQLRKENPNDSRFTRHLVWLYSNAGLVVATDEERRKLDR